MGEAPRSSYSFAVDMGVQDVWDAVTATAAFSEPQQRSNCQHFTRESLEELAKRGWLGALSSGSAFSLRNQGVADALQAWGYLDKSYKAPLAGQAGEFGDQVWRWMMS